MKNATGILLLVFSVVSVATVAGANDEEFCPQAPGVRKERWQRPRYTPIVVTAKRSPRHSAADVIVNPGRSFTLAGKFTYGKHGKDLQGERVRAYMRLERCGQWYEVGDALTDSDGRVSFTLPGRALEALGTGAYDYALAVPGDGSIAFASVWVVNPGTRTVVFDIDGTLTTGDDEVVQQLLMGWEPEAYEGASELVRAYDRAGYLIVYTTGRPYLLKKISQRWLAKNGFPKGIVRTTDSLSQAVPRFSGVGRFKLGYLRKIMSEAGVNIVAAYGNAYTDVCAYSMAGLDLSRVFIIGKHRGAACKDHGPTQAIATYPQHLEELRID